MKQNKLNLSQENMIAGIILLIIVICLILVAVIPNDKAKNVASQNVENTEDLQGGILNEEIGEYVDINELEQNTIVEENIIENEETKKDNTSTNNNKNNSTGTPYYIKVNYGAQVVTIYKKDNDGNYTVPIKAMICSTGEYTPKSGVYKIQSRWEWLRLEGYVFGHYSTQIVGNILFHSVPYLEKGNPASLEYWEYDKLGTNASAGCVRLTAADAIWIYNNCGRGTEVEFYSSADPGPLGKPVARKISNAPGNLKNWDPTDPNVNNPWKNYKPEENNTNTNTNTNIESNNNQINNNEINTQVNETNNEVYENTANNEIVNEVNTNTMVASNEISENETVNETTDETVNEVDTSTKENEVKTDDKTNQKVKK